MERQYKLLIVDDETEILNVYKSYFMKRGFSVDVACDGHEGIEKLRQDEFDIAIVDIRMPKLNGIAMAKVAIQEGIDTDIIILTGHGEKNEAIEAVNIGVSGWFEKHGISMKDLLARVTDLAEGLSEEDVSKILSAIPL